MGGLKAVGARPTSGGTLKKTERDRGISSAITFGKMLIFYRGIIVLPARLQKLVDEILLIY